MVPKKNLLRILALVAVIVIVVGILFGRDLVSNGAQEHSGGKKILYWYDPMHPQYKSDKPGTAPDCGMDLVPKYADEQSSGAHDHSAMQHDNATQNTGAGHDHAAMGHQTPATPTPAGERKILYWYDPMHPQYKSDKPGTAPDCGMDLVPKYADEQAVSATPGAVMISAERQQLIGIRTSVVQRESLVRDVRTTGQIVADESRIAHVHVKVNGFIEDVYVDYVGQFVKKGQPLFKLYSPDLVSTQQEYLIAKRGEKALSSSDFAEVAQGSQSLLRSSRERLKLWDITEQQIRKLDESGEVSRTLTFYSPITGFVMDRKAFPHTAVNPEMELYTVSDLSSVWVNADIYEYEVPFVQVGQRAQMQLSYYPGKTWNGRVSFIYPTVDPATRTVKVRLDFRNPGFQLKPGMFADIELKVSYGNQLVIPQEAVLDSGTQQSVFIALEGGHFEPRRITTGAKLGSNVIVLSGLKAGETIVTSGNFLVDSESRLKSAMGGMQHQH